MTLLWLSITFILIGMLTIAIINSLTFPRLGQTPAPKAAPLISILIPARNEACVIEQTVQAILSQSYPNFELIVLDDFSDDATAAVARTAGYKDHRLRVILGQPLPDGWLGKNWACHQLAQQAQGEWLIFTDADVQWKPQALESIIAEAERTQADLLTVWPTQQSETWAERLVVPMMALAVVGYLPLPLVHFTRWPIFAAANGQCLAFRRPAYDFIHGHAAVKHDVLEDVTLARQVKAHGLKLRMANGANHITCRMYKNWSGVREGFAKNILAGYGNSVSLLSLAAMFHWAVFMLPSVWLMFGWVAPTMTGWPWWPLLLVSLGLGLRALTAAATDQRVKDAWSMPLSVLLMTLISGQSIWWHWQYGGPRWKGRTITKQYIIKDI